AHLCGCPTGSRRWDIRSPEFDISVSEYDGRVAARARGAVPVARGAGRDGPGGQVLPRSGRTDATAHPRGAPRRGGALRRRPGAAAGAAADESVEPSRLSALVRLHRGAPRASRGLQSDRGPAGGEDPRARARAAGGQRGTCGRLLPDRRDAVSDVRYAFGLAG